MSEGDVTGAAARRNMWPAGNAGAWGWAAAWNHPGVAQAGHWERTWQHRGVCLAAIQDFLPGRLA